MRIALIPTPELACETGSTVHAVNLAAGLAQRGHDVHLFCLDVPAGLSPAITVHARPIPLVHPVLVDRPISDRELAQAENLLTAALAEEHGRAPFDILHAHYGTFTAMAARALSQSRDVPFIISCFGRDLSVGLPADPRYRAMIEQTYPAAARIIAATAETADLLASSLPGPLPPVDIIPMGLADDFATAERDSSFRAALLAGRDHLVLNISSCFAPEKGITDLIEAAGRLEAAGHRIRYVILGDDDLPDRAHARRLERLAASEGVARAISFAGRQNHPDVARYLAAADLLVDPRRIGNFSSATLEGLFTKCPIVASDVACNRDWLARDRLGQLFPKGRPEALARTIAELLTHPAAREEIRRNQAAWVAGPGARERMSETVSQTEQTYANAISGWQAGRARRQHA